MTKQVRIRTQCVVCGGTGENGLSYRDALERAALLPPTGVMLSPYDRPPTYHNRALELMKCPDCDGGWVEGWETVDEAL